MIRLISYASHYHNILDLVGKKYYNVVFILAIINFNDKLALLKSSHYF
jgi:hypothetical protein